MLFESLIIFVLCFNITLLFHILLSQNLFLQIFSFILSTLPLIYLL